MNPAPLGQLREQEQRARSYLASRHEQAPPPLRLLAVRAAGQWLLSTSTLSALRAPARLTALPLSPLWMLGLCNIHGRIAPVLDLAALLGGVHDASEPARWLVLGQERPVVVLVDEALGLREPAAPDAAPTPPAGLLDTMQSLGLATDTVLQEACEYADGVWWHLDLQALLAPLEQALEQTLEHTPGQVA